MSQSQQKKYILVAEDDSFYASVYKRKLSAEGFEVEVVDNGKKVLNKISERKPDLVLLDLIMPEMDGFQTLAQIKKDDNTKDIKVVVMSNLGQDEDIKKAKSLGAEDYLVKSNLSITEMIQNVQQYL